MPGPRCYVGLACSGHENAVALVGDDGELLFAEAAERPLQSKRALLMPPDDVFRMRALIEPRCPPDAEIVLAKTWSADTVESLGRLGRRASERMRMLARYDATQGAVEELRALRYLLHAGATQIDFAGRTAEAYLRRERGQADVDVRAYDHHLTHAAAACLTGPFERAACLVADGLGEHGGTRAFSFDRGALTAHPPTRQETGLPASLGFFFMDVCTLCGFDAAAGEEWKVMGLAAYGTRDERVLDLMRRTVAVDGLSVYRPPGALKAAAELRTLARRPDAPPLDAAGLAHCGQLVFEERMEELVRALREADASPALVLAGGCALNSSFNGRVLERSGFEDLHVFCAPADDGNAVGAALLAWREDHPEAAWSPRAQSPYLGSELSRETLGALASAGALKVRELAPDETIRLTAELLDAGRVVGWAQGRAELGPRALGNRSILADPRRPEMKARINATVKRREGFRPFAPAILDAHGERYFEGYRRSLYMERALRFREEVRAQVPAVVHEDGTGRLQSVTPKSNPRFFALLTAFHERTGVPLLLNTSLNVMGKPIVHSVEDAVALFATSGLDALVLEDHVLVKE